LAVEAALSEYVNEPEVNVDVMAYNSQVFYVILDGGGTGEQVQRFPVTGNETVLDAIAAVQGLSEVAIAKLPPLKSMARTIRSVKNRSQAPRPNPNSLGELELPEELMSTLRNEPFLLYDSGPTDEKRAVMFGTSKNLEILGDCDIWSADGTFKTYYCAWKGGPAIQGSRDHRSSSPHEEELCRSAGGCCAYFHQ